LRVSFREVEVGVPVCLLNKDFEKRIVSLIVEFSDEEE
jgi:hypothetical protein